MLPPAAAQEEHHGVPAGSAQVALMGTTACAEGTPLGGAIVQLFHGNDPGRHLMATSVTDATGRFTVRTGAGPCTLDVSYPGHTRSRSEYRSEVIARAANLRILGDIGVKHARGGTEADAAKAIVISVDYRQAPEHKFPAAHDDAIAAYKWALANAGTLNGDSLKIALAGEGAGGNLAIATAMAARDERLRPPVHVLAIYPIAGTDTTTASYVRNAYARPLNRAMMSWFLSHAIRTTADLQDKRLNLVTANLAVLPPVTIITAEIDPLATEGRTLADRLRLAGVAVERREWQNVTHEFFGLALCVKLPEKPRHMPDDVFRKVLSASQRNWAALTTMPLKRPRMRTRHIQ